MVRRRESHINQQMNITSSRCHTSSAEHRNAQSFSDSHHVPKNPTSNGGLLIPKAAQHTTSTNSLPAAQASLNQLQGPEGRSDVRILAVLPAQTSGASLVASFKSSTAQ